jgi:UDP-glucose 4-epimerase
MKILITGATGKVGKHLIKKLLRDNDSIQIKALCHNRRVETHERIEIICGSISDRETCKQAMNGVTHTVHLATCKENPDDVIDVAVKGLFWLLEEARESTVFERFLLIGGDAGIGHFVYERKHPLIESQGFKPYPGCYALSKVLEEVMLEQYVTQYDLDTCCLRAPWIIEKDDLKYSMEYGEKQFGGPAWSEIMSSDDFKDGVENNKVPILCDKEGIPLLRNFVHVEDLCSAILIALNHPKAKQELFHICTNEPVDYALVEKILKSKYGLDHVKVISDKHSTWLDNTKARFMLDWKPKYDCRKITEEAWEYKRELSDPRKIWYPG